MPRPAPKRVHPSGRLTFRRNVRAPKADDLPYLHADDAALPWTSIVGDDTRPIEVEIGCGKGAFLLEAAANNPDRFFIGIEASPPYAEYCADRIARHGLDNAVLIADDARLFFADTVPRAAISRLHVYYPDPWPKRRHRKRRLFDLEFPGLADRAMQAGGELLVASDNTRYFGEILAVLGASAHFRRDDALEARYGDEVPGVAFGPTNFSKKYEAEGRCRHRAVFTSTGLANRGASGLDGPMTSRATENWVRFCATGEIPDRGGLARRFGELELAVFRAGDGFRCLEDVCPHRGAALSDGLVVDGEVICPWHGWRYLAHNGERTTLPGSMSARTFELRIDGDDVFVRLPG